MWKESVTAYIKVLSCHMPGGTEKTHEKPQVSRSPGQDLNTVPPEYEIGMSKSSQRPVFYCHFLLILFRMPK
jgi:hypothetical protein